MRRGIIHPLLVVVTGAGSGIGRATARRYARQGATVILADIDEAAARHAAEEIGGRTYVYPLDVADPSAWESFAAAVADEHGVPDVLVNNAGILIAGTFLGHDIADWDRILGVNLMGVVHGCRTVGAQMVERGSGQIVNIASAAAFVPLRSAPAYAVTKSAVLMLSECLRIEFASSGVGVSAICPTVIRTNIASHAHVAGVDADVATRFVEAGARLQRFTWPGPDKVARAVTRAARHDWAIVPVNPDAWLTYLVSRVSPGVVRSLARVASFDVMLRGAMRLFEA